MLVFDAIPELGNGKKYDTATNFNMSESNSVETNSIMGAPENITDEESETCILTQEEVEEQIRN